ncbi:glycoside hydrolase [Microbacterium aerolatum]|uniref:F510_1955 family glycosylhydrolase n=1 Tax=Microbacterium aerolatum TaxID=153731 RepID=UPI002000940A|nr:sialidase family protein [Microbacterium aerolatum]MCK3770926.1 glycoside hydrolase [Microbacterium aerolatum]
MNRRSLALTTLSIATLALTVTGCTPQADDTNAVPPSIEHIHGIAADPRGEDLFIASHGGIFTLTETGEMTGPIGDHDFDAMGFTTLGDTLFASGHPGMTTAEELGAPNLGIIRSDDFGATWSPVALNGSADFHVLTAAPDGMLYGFASTEVELLASADEGRTWTPRASFSAADLVATADGLYAATEEGLLISTDNGASFTPEVGAPALYTIDAGEDGTLAGVGTDGVLWSYGPDGHWRRMQSLQGAAQAFSVIDPDRFVLVDDRGVVEITPDDTNILAPARPAD